MSSPAHIAAPERPPAPASCRYAEVAVAAPIAHTLTYSVPPAFAPGLAVGMRLLVPLSGRQVTGYLLGFPPAPPPGCTPREVVDILDAAPLFPESLIPFYRWIAGYYRHPLGEVIRTALPGGMSPGSGRRVTLTAAGRAELAGTDPPWLEKLLASGELPPGTVRPLWRQAKNRRLLAEWEARGLIAVTREVGRDAVGAKTEYCVRLLQEPAEEELKPSERKTHALIRDTAAESGRTWLARKDLARIYPGARKALPGLIAKGLAAGEERQVYRNPFGERPPELPPPERLTEEQTAALASIEPAVHDKSFGAFLLHGVTGSGKTEIYLRAAAAALAAGRSVVVLVPEIALATQIEGHFLSRFGDRVAILHSGLSPGEKFDQWRRLADGRAKIVIGARSAVFAPLRDPGLIIVDEEHDGAYKQEDGLRYHARDLAVLRANLQGGVVLLGSATPAVASFSHARNGKYRLLTLAKRIENRPLPEVTVVDLRQIKTVSGGPPLFSNQLTTALRANLAAGDQSLLFLNRRGFASLLLCRQCGQTLQCRHCQVSLTFHKGRQELLCHYCGYKLASASLCANCRSADFQEVGFGTERVEAELNSLFPRARVARLDRDTSADRKKYLRTLQAVREREIDILVGTQMIAKGFHFPHVTLVGVIWADAGLGMPDFRAGERTFQLLAQVTGRTGRGDKPGRVFVQTHQPDHYAIVTARHHDYSSFFEKELSLRQALGYPPYSRLINLRLDGEREAEVQAAADELAAAANRFGGPSLEVLGPAPAPLSRLRGRYRWQLLLKGAGLENLHRLCGRLLEQPPAAVRKKAVKLTVDVDPDNML